jgi:hypothetical protein
MTTELAIERGELVAQNRRPRHLGAVPAELARVRAAERRGVGGRDRIVWLATPVALHAGLKDPALAQLVRRDRPTTPAAVVGDDAWTTPPAWPRPHTADQEAA